MNENIGSMIRKLRKEKDITQEELAELLGITSQAVSKWESGVSHIIRMSGKANFYGK